MEINFPNEGMPKMPSFRFAPWIIPVVLILVFLSLFGSLFYQIEPDEVGVVQRFGKYVRTTRPGLHIKLPFSIETVIPIKVTHVFKEEFGFRTVTGGVHSVFEGRTSTRTAYVEGRRGDNPFVEESLMLTGDLNVAVVQWIVQYRVKDPVQFAFRIRNARETIRNMSEAMMRLVVGDRTINEVLTSGREEIQIEMEKKLQEVLDSYGVGIEILNVILQDVNPPDEVKPSFNEVNEARQEKEKLINQAWEEYNRVIPKAKGEAEQMIRESEGYAVERTNRAKGDAERFLLTLDAYKQAPVVTKRRLYLETVEKVMPLLKEKYFFDSSQKGMLPFLNLSAEKERVQS